LFLYIITTEHLATIRDYLIGIPLGIALIYIGVLRLIDWMSNEKITYIFSKRNLLPEDRKNNISYCLFFGLQDKRIFKAKFFLL
jgi:hypothetical protein